MKYRPAFPGQFGSIQDTRAHCQVFFPCYNNQHRHSGLGLHTPADVHYGRAPAVQTARAGVLAAAYHAHPERFVSQPPAPPKLPTASWINRPQPHPDPHTGPSHPDWGALMPSMTLDAGDAGELAEMLSFPSQWLSRDPARLGASLEDFAGHPPTASSTCATIWTASSACSAAATKSSSSPATTTSPRKEKPYGN